MKIQKIYITILFCTLSFLFFNAINLYSQETNSHISGIIKSSKNEILTDATIIAVHEPTRNTFITKTNTAGYFY